MPQTYTPEFRKKIVRLHEEEGRTYKSITAEYGVSKASISKWCREFSEECQEKALSNPDTPNGIVRQNMCCYLFILFWIWSIQKKYKASTENKVDIG